MNWLPLSEITTSGMPLKGKMALHFLDTGTGFSVGQVVYFPEIGKVVNQYQVIFATEGEVISSNSFPGAVGRFLAHQGFFLLFGFVGAANFALLNELFHFSTHPRPEHTFPCSPETFIHADM